MNLFSQLLAGAMIILLIILILYVVFGQITVRKLRKNPETKEALGFEYASGTDITNVIKILGISRSRAEKLSKGRMSILYANVDLIYKYTNQLDRALAKTLYWLMVFWGLFMAILMGFYFTGMLN